MKFVGLQVNLCQFFWPLLLTSVRKILWCSRSSWWHLVQANFKERDRHTEEIENKHISTQAFSLLFVSSLKVGPEELLIRCHYLLPEHHKITPSVRLKKRDRLANLKGKELCICCFIFFLAFHHLCLGDEQAAECIRNSKLSSFYLYLSQVTVAELKDHVEICLLQACSNVASQIRLCQGNYFDV